MYLHYLKLKNRLASFVSSRIAKLALDTKITPKELKMTLDNKCLVLVANPMDEAIGLAGLMLTYPKNFEILLMTTGYTDEGTIGGIASHVAISDEIKYAMETLRPLGYKIFDIPAGAIHKAQRIFEKINISEIDYLFLPNIFSRNPDDIALLDNVAALLEETEYKKNLKIVFFEVNSTLISPNYFFDITSKLKLKGDLINSYKTRTSNKKWFEIIEGLNRFRGYQNGCDYAEAFTILTVEDFLKLLK